MNDNLKIQRLCFLALSSTLLVIFWIFPDAYSPRNISIPLLSIILLGIPHGAVDTVFAEKMHAVSGVKNWVKFGLFYLAIASLVVAVWILSPKVYLAGFLLISVMHFAGDPGKQVPLASRLLYGGAVVVLPALRHAGEIERLLGFLTDTATGFQAASGLSRLAGPWLIGLSLAAVSETRKSPLRGLEYGALALILVFLPPLPSFAIYFCAMHSARHLLRTIFWARIPVKKLVLMGAMPMLITLIVALAVYIFPVKSALDAHLIRWLFVGLAALTVPHMLLVEQAPLSRPDYSVAETG